jgi:perosamine synthetase
MRQITFYFQTLTVFDSFAALVLSLVRFFGFPDLTTNRNKFVSSTQNIFNEREIYLYNSARSALYTLLKALNLSPDSEVIVTGFTCDVVANSVIQAGLTPVYADINEGNFCMSVDSVKANINPKTKVIIIQHTLGIPADLNELIEIASKHDLYIIEDCAVSLGSKYKGKYTGTFGDAAIFSFELSKTITSCRGGMLFINTNKHNGIEKHKILYNIVPEQSRKYSSHLLFQLGINGLLYSPIIFHYIGKYIASFLYKKNIFKRSTTPEEFKATMPLDYVQKLSGNQCIILLRQLSRLSLIKSNSIRISLKYINALKSHSNIKLPTNLANYELNMIRFPILVQDRNQYITKLETNLIEPGLWFTAPLSSDSINHSLFMYKTGACPTAERISGQMLNLPLHMKLINRDIDKIINSVKSV